MVGQTSSGTPPSLRIHSTTALTELPRPGIVPDLTAVQRLLLSNVTPYCFLARHCILFQALWDTQEYESKLPLRWSSNSVINGVQSFSGQRTVLAPSSLCPPIIQSFSVWPESIGCGFLG